MQSDQAPCIATGRVEFPSSVTNCLRNQRNEFSPLFGSILSDTSLAWLTKGPLFEVVHTSDGAKVAAWTFGAVVRDFTTKVTCVAELPHLMPCGNPGRIDQMVVGLECELTGGMLCLFNLAGSRVLRAINVPSKVTALNIVVLGGEAPGPIHQCLQSMNGIAAVGTIDGQILLIDLRRNECDEALRSGPTTHWEGVRDELQSCGLISMKTVNANILEDYPDDHLYLHLNEKYFLKHRRLALPLPAREGNTLLPEDPSITSLLYVPQLASLFVGFAFGSFQIWSLQALSLMYTLPVNEPNPVVQLSFQEACDDPNAYCYLWAVRGGLDCHNSDGDLDNPVQVFGPPSATMFSLCYDEKVWLPDYGHFYKNFMMCSTGFEFDLTGGKETVGGRLISLYSVSRGMSVSGSVAPVSEDSSVAGHSSNAVSLCLLVWETWGPTGPSSSVNPVNTHIAVFDINQWYVDQMPSRLSQHGSSSRKRSVANYLVSFNLSNVISASGGLLLDVRINASSLVQFSSVQNVEEFSRPASLSFCSELLMERQVVHLKHPGVQRALLSSLVSTGPGALMTPTNLFHECLVLGLRPLLMDISSTVNVPLDEQRTFVLCVALEQRLGRFVCRCAREWADGRLSAAGCTLSWLLSVAWNRAAILKQLAIRLSAQLFDHSGEKLDSNAQRQLHHIVGIFHLLETLFENVVQNKWHLSLNEWPQVDLQNDALKLECQYYDVLQWLIDVELLPEGLNPAVPYPAQDIAEFYHSRRLELQRLFQQQEEEVEDLLFIDELLKNQPGGANVFAEWERDAGGSAGPGAGRYPPISLQALLRTFLIKDVALDVKHSVVIYVLMDLANILDNEQYQATLQNFMKFPAAFSMSNGTMRLTQAFWHLDHKAFDTALDMLLDPLVSVRDIAPWQHRRIIRLLTFQGQANMALRYLRTRRPPLQEQADIRLHLKLLIANDLINEAFIYQRSHRSDKNFENLLSLFFQGCEEHNQLRTVLQFSLDDEEEIAFSRYLEVSRHPAADDLRVLYLLKRSRYIEALDVNQDLKKKGRSGGTRDIVVSGFYKSLPSVTRKLATHCAQQQSKLKSWTQVDKPTPLFVNPKITSPQMRYKSSLLEIAVEKSRETWAKLVGRVPQVTSEVESTPFLCTPRTKLNQPRPITASVQSTELEGTQRKRARSDDDADMDAGNFKRSRFQKLETALAKLQQQQQVEQQKSIQGRLSTYSCTDTLPLLHTPVVQRRSPSSRAKLQQQMIACSPGHSSLTPQSIIKVRTASCTSKSDSPKQVLIMESMNDPELTEEESESEPFAFSRKATKGESETDSEPGDNDEEGPVGVSARRTIDFNSDISSDLSLSQSSYEPYATPSKTKSPTKTSITSSEASLSRMVVLSEARKAGKPHTVTFGKGSICVYDQDEPVDSEVAVQDESSNDTVDQDPIQNENIEEDSSRKEQNTDASQEPDCENSRIDGSEITMEVEPSKNRSFGLETSGICSMSSSEIQPDFSCTEDSEVFHSADSTAQGTMCSPNFRKSLARPSVIEIANRLSGNKRTQDDVSKEDDKENDYDDNNDDETAESGKNVEVRKSARLEGGKLHASTSRTPAYLEKEEEHEILPETSSPTKTTVEVCSSSNSLARSPIRKAPCFSVGKTDDWSYPIVTQEKNQTTEKLQDLFVAEEGRARTHDREQVDFESSAVDEVDEQMGQNEPDIHLHKSQDSVEIVLLDDDSISVEEDCVSQVVEVPEDEEVQSVEEDVIMRSDAGGANEDSNDQVVISENSNIFGVSLTDDDSSSNSRSDSSESQQDTERKGMSEYSDSEVSMNDSDHNPPSSVYTEVSADVLEPQTYNEGTDPSQACANVSKDLITGASNYNTGFKENAKARSFALLVSETIEEEMNFRKADPHTYSEINQQSNKGTDVEPDDMPRLVLDAATSNENLCESPGDAAEISEQMDVEMPATMTFGSPASSKAIDTKPSSPTKGSSPPGLKTGTVGTSDASTPLAQFEISEPSTLKTKRRGTRRSSISSIISENTEEEVFNRRVTRSQRSLMDQSFESTTSTQDKTSEMSSSEAQEQKVTSVHRRTRKSSQSPQDEQEDAPKQIRNRHSSMSSVGSATQEVKEAHDIKTRKRRASVSSQGSVTENNIDTTTEGKLEKITEEESSSDKVSVSNDKSGRKSQRKRRTSEVGDITRETQVKAEVEGGSASPNSSVMQTYETSRRLTRHQRALLAKSIELNSVHTSMSTSVQHIDDAEGEHVSDDDDRMSFSSVRSSQRLRAKRQQQEGLNDSPSSTASTVINPALTPLQRRRGQSCSDVSELNRDNSPVSSHRRQRSIQLYGTPSSLRSTPTRRSARLNALHGGSGSHQSEDGDNQSLASLSPSSMASGRKSATRRPPRRLSVSSEAQSEPYAFASPEVEHSSIDESADADLTEAFVFSPPKTVATPSKARSSSTDSGGSASKKATRQTRASSALPAIKEESSTSRVSVEDLVNTSSPAKSRQSWFFIQQKEEPIQEKKEVLKTNQQSQRKRGLYSAFTQRKMFSVEPPPQNSDSEDDSESDSEESEEETQPILKTRQTTANRRQKK